MFISNRTSFRSFCKTSKSLKIYDCRLKPTGNYSLISLIHLLYCVSLLSTILTCSFNHLRFLLMHTDNLRLLFTLVHLYSSTSGKLQE